MSESNGKKSFLGIGLGGIVFLIFLVLKLANIGVVANWSWFWVTSPLWIPILIVIAVLIIIFIIGLIFAVLNK